MSEHPAGSSRASHPAVGPAPAPAHRFVDRLAGLLVGRRSAWAVLALGLLVSLAVIGGLTGGGPAAGMDALPASAESARASAIATRTSGAGEQQVFAVITRADGAELTAADRDALPAVQASLTDASGAQAAPATVSEDGRAAVLGAPVDVLQDKEGVDGQVAALRAAASTSVPSGLHVDVTGGPAIGTDIRGAFKGANFTLLAVTVAVVGALLLLTYRSPVLWLVPLTVVALADRVASSVANQLGARFDLAFDAGVISVLVFGAGTNYALLLISRYREELRGEADHRLALRRAWTGSLPAILASNLTVVLALLTLVAAVMPATRGLGIAAAAGLLIAALAVLLPLTAALAVCGRRLFWPLVPRPETAPETPPAATMQSADALRPDAPRGPFAAVARAVTRRPLIATLGSLAVLGVLAAGLIGTRVGLAQDEQFASANESSTGLAALADHFGVGEAGPHLILTPTADAERTREAASHSRGILRVVPADTTADGWSMLAATGSAEPESAASRTEVEDLRAAVRSASDGRALVGGQSAQALDVHEDSRRDLLVIAPMVLGVVLLVLIVLLRALVAPIVLVAVNVTSAVAAIGLGLWVGRTVLGIPALDATVPLLAFLFLVALGVDYTIFLAHRVRQEAVRYGTREGTVRAVGHTGVVITSAGVVLAAVFAALGVLPLVVLGQLGLIVGLGVLLDTLLVRAVLVPALFALIGERMWWPSRPALAAVRSTKETSPMTVRTPATAPRPAALGTTGPTTTGPVTAGAPAPRVMSRLLTASCLYLVAGLVGGLYYRELTRGTAFADGAATQLSVVHTHLLTLGFLALLIVLALERAFTLSSSRMWGWFFWTYNAGIVVTTGSMIWHGTLTVLGGTPSPMIAGIAGIGHMLLSLGTVLLIAMLFQAVRRADAQRGTGLVPAAAGSGSTGAGA